MMDIELDHTVRGGEPRLRTRRMNVWCSLNTVRHKTQVRVVPIVVSGVATSGKNVTHWRCHP